MIYILSKTKDNPELVGMFTEKEDAIAYAIEYGHDNLLEVDLDDKSTSVSVTFDGERLNHITKRVVK